mmetsp:Transcript_16937/g.38726  ORF Transcript_16937/g.38726 Transcript_16937/m.38726 type:complete len:218 (+) Transcript_16937:17-670(+)
MSMLLPLNCVRLRRSAALPSQSTTGIASYCQGSDSQGTRWARLMQSSSRCSRIARSTGVLLRSPSSRGTPISSLAACRVAASYCCMSNVGFGRCCCGQRVICSSRRQSARTALPRALTPSAPTLGASRALFGRAGSTPHGQAMSQCSQHLRHTATIQRAIEIGEARRSCTTRRGTDTWIAAPGRASMGGWASMTARVTVPRRCTGQWQACDLSVQVE